MRRVIGAVEEHGVDALLLENMHDFPCVPEREMGPEIAAYMTRMAVTARAAELREEAQSITAARHPQLQILGILMVNVDKRVRAKFPRRLLYEERKLAFAADLLPVLDQYTEKYQPQENLFECTPRNLEYVLADVSEQAGLPQQVSFEMLRWTSALRDYRDGMDHDRLRKKMGLSKITWRETSEKLAKISDPGL